MLPLAAAATMAPGLAGQLIKAGAQQGATKLLQPAAVPMAIGASALSQPARTYRQELRADTKAMQAGKLGYSEAQKNQMMNATNQQIQASQQGLRDEARRMAAAGGLGSSGASNALMKAAAQANASAAAQARSNVDMASQAQALARRGEILERNRQQRDTIKSNWLKVAEGLKPPSSDSADKVKPDLEGLNTTFGVK